MLMDLCQHNCILDVFCTSSLNTQPEEIGEKNHDPAPTSNGVSAASHRSGHDSSPLIAVDMDGHGWPWAAGPAP